MRQRMRDIDDINVLWVERERPDIPTRVREDHITGDARTKH